MLLDRQPDTELSPEMLRIALRKYKAAWDAYVEAGCPFGETDRAMLIWFAFRAYSREN